MNRRQRIIVSVTGIFIVLLILIGLTYAYFLTRITGNSNPTSISVTTANLELIYGDGTTSILTSETPIEPGKFSSSKDFTVTNNGNALTDYAITLEDFSIVYANDTVINGQNVKAGTVTKMEYPDDMKMDITCVIESDEAERDGQNCTNQVNESTLPTENSILLTNSVEVGDTHKYVLTLTYVDSGIDQSKDMNKTIRGKIDIIDPKSTIDLTGTVANYQAGDYAEINSTPIKSEIVDGKYKIIGVEPGTHTLYIKYKDANGDIGTRGSQSLTIKKGNIENVSDNDITITDISREIIVNFNNNYSIAIDREIKGYIPFKENTFAFKIINSAQKALSNNEPLRTIYNDSFNLNSISKASSETDRMLALTADDYGTSYVFRGSIKDNFVKFAGFIWRIVRINGDGTIRLILEGTLDKVKREGTSTYAGTITKFNTSSGDNAFVGYMYGLSGMTEEDNVDKCLMLINDIVENVINEVDFGTKELCEKNGGKWTTTAYEATHANVENSTIKTKVDTFYETYLENNSKNYHYEKYLADSIICVDKVSDSKGFGKNNIYYASQKRFNISNGIVKPILKCAYKTNNNLSRYTVNERLINGITTNGDLTYPIGLLSIDELLMSSLGINSSPISTNYLSDAYTKGKSYYRWWTGTPREYSTVTNSQLYVSDNYITDYAGYTSGGILNDYGIRPVINLKADLLVKSGDGTENNPYEILEIN